MRGAGRRGRAIGLAAVLLLGAAAAALGVVQARRRAQAEADAGARSASARDAERTAFCKDRRRVVNAHPATSGPLTVLIAFDPSFPTRDRLEYKASYVAERLRASPQCAAQGVDYLVDEAWQPPGAASAGRAPPRYERVRVCEEAPVERGDDFGARYRLAYGERTTERSAASGDEFAASSVRLVDGATGAVLAEDVLYFVNNWAGRHAGCPDARDQVAALLASAFARGPTTPAPSASPVAQGKP